MLAHSCQAAQIARTNGLNTCVAAKADLEPSNAQNKHRRRQTRCDRIQLLTPVSDLKTPIAQMCNLKLDTPPRPPHSMLTSRARAAADKDGRFQIRRGQHSRRAPLATLNLGAGGSWPPCVVGWAFLNPTPVVSELAVAMPCGYNQGLANRSRQWVANGSPQGCLRESNKHRKRLQ